MAATAVTFKKAADQATADLPVECLERLTKNGHAFTWIATREISAVQLHEGAVLKNGQRLPAQPWTVIAQAEVNLANEFSNNLSASRILSFTQNCERHV